MRKWTIMLYIAADETLANFAIASLKQLRGHASKDLAIAVQFDPDGASHVHKIRRYIFDETNRDQEPKAEERFWGDAEHRSLDMTKPGTLTHFINWVYKECKAENYCLVFWGHGPELLFEAPTREAEKTHLAGSKQTTKASKTEKRLYFTPLGLRKALKHTDPTEAKNLRIIGIDACSMSMFEVAYELRNLADFMIASQEEVPDQSFPYDALMQDFVSSTTPEEFCKKCVVDYVNAYKLCICSPSTGMHPVTLAAIRLKKVGLIKEPLQRLVETLKSANAKEREAIHKARKKAQGFVGGLFVDLYDFCHNLRATISTPAKMKVACAAVCEAIDGSKSIEGIVLERQGVVHGHVARSTNPNFRSHGLSIYFPYLNELNQEYIEQGLVKGIPRMVDKSSEIAMGYQGLNALTAQIRYFVRREIIRDTEQYYPDLEFAKETGWYQFIQQCWSRILVEREPNNLDIHYLAQQCAVNLVRDIPAKKPHLNGAEKEWQPERGGASPPYHADGNGKHPLGPPQ